MTIQAICQTLIPGYDPFANAGDCWFDDQAAQDAVDFFPACLRHVEGAVAGKPFALEPWQQAIIGNLFGWKRRDAHGRVIRRYRECLLYVPRKNGKTPLIAGLAAYVFFCEPEKGQQDYVAAADKEQAGMLFRHLKGMVEQEPELASRCQVLGGNASIGPSKSLVRASDGAFLRVISADASTKHGGNPHLTIMDELHAQPNAELYDVLHTGMASQNRAQPLFISLTTADFDRPSVCNERHDYACQVRDGLIDDPTFLPVVYETLRDDDWTDPRVWATANPNLGVSVSEDYLRGECAKAQKIPRLENTFKRLHLNMRTESDERWLDLAAWDDGDCAFDPTSLEGEPCWCGLDLSSTTDLSAFVAVFRVDDCYRVLARLWLPADNLRTKSLKDKVSYETWVNGGYIETTPGNTIKYDHIRQFVNDFGQRHQIEEIAVDRWNATQLADQLTGDGFTVFAFGQGYKDMSPASKELERAILAREISANKNPVIRWMVGNVMSEQDAAGNVKPSKAKSTERIDGVVAMIMGVGRAALNAEANSAYSSEGVMYVGAYSEEDDEDEYDEREGFYA